MDFTGTKLTTLDIILLIAYIMVCTGIGLWSSKNQNKDDYLIAGSSILANISGWSYETALMISSLVIIIYLFAGGYRSVVKTDIFQYIILFVLFILPGFVLLTEKRAMAADLLDLSRMSLSMTIAFIAFGVFIIFSRACYSCENLLMKSPNRCIFNPSGNHESLCINPIP